MTAKALHHTQALCKREEVQRFLSSLVSKPPEVGHLVNCFHMAKPNRSAYSLNNILLAFYNQIKRAVIFDKKLDIKWC